MSTETTPLNGGGDAESLTPPLQRRRRRVKGHCSPALVGILATFCIVAISLGLFVVIRAEHRRRAPKQLWLNTNNNVEGENTTAAVSAGCETTILLMRHCEKYGPLVHGNKNQHCSYLGFERAHFMSKTLFGSSKSGGMWPNPSLLYALSPDRGSHDNYRQVETLTPTATKLGLNINTDFKEGEEVAIAINVFQKIASGEMCGNTTVISWTHRSLPQLAAALGCGRFTPQNGGCPARYPEDSFDQVWMLKYVYEPESVVLPRKKQKKHAPSNQWAVYPTVTQMGFDPLKFSHMVGDYPEGGKARGGAWSKEL